MGASLLEVTRSLHEDMERFQQAILEELEYQPRSHRETVFQVHRVNHYLDGIQDSTSRLINIYEDKDGTRREEANKMAGSGPALYSLFYDKLREVRDFHKKGDAKIEYPEDRVYNFDEDELDKMFSGEEQYGKCLDLHIFFDTYINLKPSNKEAKKDEAKNRIDYITYLDLFYLFNDDLTRKENKEYKKYISELNDYLVNFYKKSHPLTDTAKVLHDINSEFERLWISDEFKGWEAIYPETAQKSTLPAPAPIIKQEKKDDDDKKDRRKRDRDDNDKKDDRKSRETKKPDVVVPLDQNPLYCKYCDKLFAKDTVFNAHLPGKKHLAAVKKIDQADQIRKNYKDVYASEWRIHHLCKTHLTEQIESSKVYIGKKQSKTLRELMQEQEEDFYAEDANVDYDPTAEEPEIKVSKDNYPVGWDGKPIPYWLYKLHGLGVEYKCEICGNASYWGRKAYEKHFQEWRHAHGMRCLGIPNGRSFHDITKITDAIALWQKIRRDTTDKAFKAEAEEEFEDKEGNVYNKKTYEDLKRQGLI